MYLKSKASAVEMSAINLQAMSTLSTMATSEVYSFIYPLKTLIYADSAIYDIQWKLWVICSDIHILEFIY